MPEPRAERREKDREPRSFLGRVSHRDRTNVQPVFKRFVRYGRRSAATVRLSRWALGAFAEQRSLVGRAVEAMSPTPPPIPGRNAAESGTPAITTLTDLTPGATRPSRPSTLFPSVTRISGGVSRRASDPERGRTGQPVLANSEYCPEGTVERARRPYPSAANCSRVDSIERSSGSSSVCVELRTGCMLHSC